PVRFCGGAMSCNPGSDALGDVDRLDEPPLELLPRAGIYTIVILVESDLEFRSASLGAVTIKKGCYAYTGSALGQGPLSLRGRLSRHLRRTKKLKWHIDYLTSNSSVRVEGVVASVAGKAFECMVASHLNGLASYVEGFGCSDCRCPSHLALLPFPHADACLRLVEAVYRELGLTPISLVVGR
ncbi:MAG: GIY-YIG nuclease family protein, partial [Desulfurococcaceae archaeon]